MVMHSLTGLVWKSSLHTVMPRKPRGSTDAPPLTRADDNQLYTVEQTCRLLQISDWLVRKFVRNGKLPAVFIEGMTRIRAADLRAYLAQRLHTVEDLEELHSA